MKPSDQQLSSLERNFINAFQGGFPLHEQPFEQVAKQLDCSEKKLIDTIDKLKQQKTLTRFGPLYDTARLGGGLTLAAMSVPKDRFDMVTQQVNAYPEVAHNYRRDHPLNMWFVLATETPVELVQVISSIEKDTALTVYNFPKQHEFYIGLQFDISEHGIHETVSFPIQKSDENYLITDLDKKIIKQTQAGLPVTTRPYLDIARNIGCNESDVITHLRKMLDSGVIRRIGAVPDHFRLGFKANGMTVWDVPDERIMELGNQVGQLSFVSHSYQRPRHLPLWRYNLFAMVHGHTRDTVNEKTEQIEQILGESCRAHEVLYSTAILKKTGLRLAA
ncbi:MAG TPA: Lrp/AsnC family transcriptional regulator [Gammaproteobacteria bacterium]|nr:Lrp/AsnC family transcriptional regulator [Gammaproteobacteria bacterium]